MDCRNSKPKLLINLQSSYLPKEKLTFIFMWIRVDVYYIRTWKDVCLGYAGHDFLQIPRGKTHTLIAPFVKRTLRQRLEFKIQNEKRSIQREREKNRGRNLLFSVAQRSEKWGIMVATFFGVSGNTGKLLLFWRRVSLQRQHRKTYEQIYDAASLFRVR